MARSHCGAEVQGHTQTSRVQRKRGGNVVFRLRLAGQLLGPALQIRVRPRFFDQVGHETMYASSGNKHFFTKSCHRQTYQNYEQPP